MCTVQDFTFLTNLSLCNNVVFNYYDDQNNLPTSPLASPDSPLNQINCEYLDTFDFVKNVKPKLMEETKLNVICFNIRSIRDKWANFKDLVLINGYCPFDVIGITETWLSEIDDKNEFSLPGFQAIHIERKLTKSSGGISLYIRSSLKFTRLLDCESLFSQPINNRCIYSIIVDISVDENSLIFSLFYKPPSFPTPFFCNLFDDFSSFINLPQKKAIVFGDFNCNLLNVSNNNDCDTFFETFTSSGLLPTILFPTRVDPMRSTATLIDNIFVSTSLGNHLSSKIIFSDLSDHFPIYLSLPSLSATQPRRTNTPTSNRIYNTVNMNRFTDCLKSFDWSKTLDCQDVNSATSSFTQGLSDLISSTFPVRKSNRKTTHIRPWMSNSLIISSYRKNDLYKLACKTSSVIDLTNYKKYKNIYTKLIREAKKNYYYSKISHCKGNLQKIWSTINEILSKKRNSRSVPINLRDISGRLIDPILVPDAFNNYFTNIPNANSCSFSQSVHPSKNPRSMFFSPTDRKEVLQVIESLSNSSTPDFFCISNKLLRTVSSYIC